MTHDQVTQWRDPVQLYYLRTLRRRLIILGVVVLVLIAAAYWYLYLA
jgi:hypothetical protein